MTPPIRLYLQCIPTTSTNPRLRRRRQVLPPHYSGGNSHLAVVSKRLSKRDVTTKLKALTELRAMCR